MMDHNDDNSNPNYIRQIETNIQQNLYFIQETDKYQKAPIKLQQKKIKNNQEHFISNHQNVLSQDQNFTVTLNRIHQDQDPISQEMKQFSLYQEDEFKSYDDQIKAGSEFFSISAQKSKDVASNKNQGENASQPIQGQERSNSLQVQQDQKSITREEQPNIRYKIYEASPQFQQVENYNEEDQFYSIEDVMKYDQEQHEEKENFFTSIWNGSFVKAIKQKLGFVQEEIKHEFSYLDTKAKALFNSQKNKLNTWVRIKIEESIMTLLGQLRPQIQESLKDPYMFQCVKDFVDDAVDEVWPTVEDEVLFKLRLKIDQPTEFEKQERPEVLCCCQHPWNWLKAWYLYTVDPYDKSFWQQVRTSSWWFFLIIRLIPTYGLQSYFYLIIFAMIDKYDEYQLVNFILNFKRMQFFSVGVFGSIFGYFMFFNCTSTSSNSQFFIDCRKQGPAIYLNELTDVLAFLIQLGLVWITFLFLPCSQPKGKLKFRYSKPITDPETRCMCYDFNVDRGGRLKGFIIWDAFTFLICLCVFLFVSFGGTEISNEQIRANMYFVKTLYGLMSFPFIVFVLPYMTFLFTRARETAYDVYGNCVPKIKDLKKYHKLKKMKSLAIDKKFQENLVIDEYYVEECENMAKKYAGLNNLHMGFIDNLIEMDEKQTDDKQ